MDISPKHRHDHLLKVNIITPFNNIFKIFILTCIYIINIIFVTKYIEEGDIVIANIDEINEDGIRMHMVCFDNHKRRDLTDFRFEASFFRNLHIFTLFCNSFFLKLTCPIEYASEKYTNNIDTLSKIATIYFQNDLGNQLNIYRFIFYCQIKIGLIFNF
jgi:hypothetical protein